MVVVTERIYRTDDGRLVGHGDPDAAFLAFPKGHELSAAEADRYGVTAYLAAKSAPQVANKMAARPVDKSRQSPTAKEGTS